mgnify:CR=1 FL=1
MIKQEGIGWRIFRDELRDDFSTLIGGENWAIELTESEWKSLVQAVFDLFSQYYDVKDQLMGDEDITLELARNPWLAILKGDQFGWSLKLILASNSEFTRGAEVSWPRNVTESVLNAMRKMWDSCYL